MATILIGEGIDIQWDYSHYSGYPPGQNYGDNPLLAKIHFREYCDDNESFNSLYVPQSVYTTLPAGLQVSGLAMHPTTKVIYGVSGGQIDKEGYWDIVYPGTYPADYTWVPDAWNPLPVHLLKFTKGKPTTIIGPPIPVPSMNDITFTPDGRLIGISGESKMYHINLTTGHATVFGDDLTPYVNVNPNYEVYINTWIFYDYVTSSLYGGSTDYYAIDPNTGVIDTGTTYTESDWVAVAQNIDTLEVYALYDHGGDTHIEGFDGPWGTNTWGNNTEMFPEEDALCFIPDTNPVSFHFPMGKSKGVMGIT